MSKVKMEDRARIIADLIHKQEKPDWKVIGKAIGLSAQGARTFWLKWRKENNPDLVQGNEQNISQEIVGAVVDMDNLSQYITFNPDMWEVSKADFKVRHIKHIPDFNQDMDWDEGKISGHKDRGASVITPVTNVDITLIRKRMVLTREDVVELFKGIDLGGMKVSKVELYHKDGIHLEVQLADIHVGIRAYSHVDDARKRIQSVISQVVAKAKRMNLPIALIYLVLPGDILHFDNMSYTTTAGTRQDNAMTYPEAFKQAVEIICWAGMELSKLAPVDMIYTPGNHDYISSFGIIQAVSMFFKDNKNVTVDSEHEDFKVRQFGNVIFGTGHADRISIKKLGSYLATFHRKLWGKSLYAEMHLAHVHHEEVKEEGGTKLRWLPTSTPNDHWHTKNLYDSDRVTQCFVWDREDGLQDSWYIRVKE